MKSSPTRILLVVPSASSFRVFLRELAERWVAEGGEIAVATADDLPGVVDDGWPRGVLRFALPDFRKGGVLGVFRAGWALRRIAREWRPQLVHAHLGVAALVCALVRGSHQAKWIATIQGLHGSIRESGAGMIGWVERWCATRLDRTYVVSEMDRAFLGQRVDALRLGVQRGFGCDLRRFDSARFSAERRLEIRESLSLESDDPVMIFLGRQVAFKGFATVIRAWNLARRELPNVRLLLVGAADPVHSNGLNRDEAALLADPALRNLGWRTDVEALLAIADVCVFPSRREGMPVNLMEALAMGVPVITSDSRGCRDVVRDGVDGIVMATAEPAAWAQACLALLRDEAQRAAYRAAALAGRGRFDRQLFIDEQLGIWRGFACRDTFGREHLAPRRENLSL